MIILEDAIIENGADALHERVFTFKVVRCGFYKGKKIYPHLKLKIDDCSFVFSIHLHVF